MEWMVLASRKRTPPVGSIFRAGVRVRVDRAASAQRAATTPRRLPPPRRAGGATRDSLPRGMPVSPRTYIYSVFIQVPRGSTSTLTIEDSEVL